MGLLKRDLFSGVRSLAAALLAALALTAGPAGAAPDEPREKARQLADQGKAALARKDYAAAADLFGRAAAFVSAPTLDLGRARAEVGLGHLLMARQIYAHIAAKPPEPRAPPAFVKAVSEAAEELAELERNLPSVRFIVHGPTAAQVQVLLDGAPLSAADLQAPRLLDPGPHVARATAPEFRPVEMTFTAAAGVASQVQLDLEVEPFGPRRRRTMQSAALIGLGAGALVFGGVTGAFALGDRSLLFSRCPNQGRCTEDERTLIDAYHRSTRLAWPALATGAAAVGVGTALFLSSSRDGAFLRVKLGPALLGAGIAGLSFGAASGFVSLGERPDPTLGAIAIGSLATGAVAAVSGTLLLLLAKDSSSSGAAASAAAPARQAASAPPPQATFSPYFGPGSAGLLGRF